MKKSTRELLGYTVFPVVFFALVLPLVGILNTSGGFLTSLLAGVLFAGFSWVGVGLADSKIKIKGSSPHVAFSNLAILMCISTVALLLSAGLFPAIHISSVVALIVAGVLYPFAQKLVIGV